MSELEAYIRTKLAERFDACLAANTCPDCDLLRCVPAGDDFMCPWCGDIQPYQPAAPYPYVDEG